MTFIEHLLVYLWNQQITPRPTAYNPVYFFTVVKQHLHTYSEFSRKRSVEVVLS
jgi:hypothetical protein